MWILLSYVLISFIMPLVMGMTSLLVSSKFMSTESFECGFDSFNVSVFPVSLRFFMFCTIFLILDLELIIMSVTPMVIWSSGFIVNIVLFLLLVTVSLMMEWLFGSLSWIE
uniref:NADH-ubiquinone oxidoreductase chain 3 n=1 Tax=Rotaria rotatoria TaxID=231624 RepID=D1KRT2_9BILA|nr:NADH dehydrogenase subunit 3 [Rotaria rotatoria]ACT21464.1 NADH dehydrogenase subunit 3 [Rotaria rotatoria]